MVKSQKIEVNETYDMEELIIKMGNKTAMYTGNSSLEASCQGYHIF